VDRKETGDAYRILTQKLFGKHHRNDTEADVTIILKSHKTLSEILGKLNSERWKRMNSIWSKTNQGI
jgi:hypothetical protein